MTAAVPPLSEPAVRPFAIQNYRRQWVSDLCTSCAFEIETLALAWYVLTETGSVVLMAAIASLQYLGTLLSPLLGVLSDRHGQRNTMLAMRMFYAVVAVMLLVFAHMRWLTPWLALGFATLSGLVRPSDIGMRNVVTSGIVPGYLILPAIGLSRMTTDLARMGGALAGAALMATLGLAWAYVIVVALYVVAAFFTYRLRMARVAPHGAGCTVLGQFGAALRSVRGAPAQTATMIMAFLVNFSAYPFVTGLLPYVAKERFGMDEYGLGTLIAVTATGSITSSILLSRLRLPNPAVTMLCSSIAWHVLIVIFAASRSLPFVFASIYLAGVAQNLCMIPMAAFLLGKVSPAVRGSVIGLRSMAVYGLPLGLMLSGYILNHGAAFWGVALGFAATGITVTLLVWVSYRTHFRPGLAQQPPEEATRSPRRSRPIAGA
ncbi:MFS transporter [Achromobacter aloeverae]|uniref:MFS transporter n=1 Tax=Achromobacter aloeverae TaxID=1750518 RepID=UPI0013018C80|nr:MFS transporter [Achromobacter aloeverae]